MSRFAAVAAVFVGALLGGRAVGPSAGASAPACARSVGAIAVRLPAAIAVTTRCAVYTISPAGRVEVARLPRRPEGITSMLIAGPNARVVQRGGRIAVLRNGREAWRSVGRFRAAAVFATIGSRAVAFSYESYRRRRSDEALYLASLDGPERKLARDERPLGWTSDGTLLTWRFRQGLLGLYLRGADGKLSGRVGARLRELRFEPAAGTALALTRRGVLERYDGRWRRLADLGRLGFGRRASFEPLARGLLGVLEGRHVTVLRNDGSLFASARFPARPGRFSVAGESGLVANAAGTAVAFAVTRGRAGAEGVESLYVLRRRDLGAREVYSGRVPLGCGHWASLGWHGDWLLYATAGKTIVLDSRAPAHRVDLTSLVSRLASTSGGQVVTAQVRWASGRGR